MPGTGVSKLAGLFDEFENPAGAESTAVGVGDDERDPEHAGTVRFHYVLVPGENAAVGIVPFGIGCPFGGGEHIDLLLADLDRVRPFDPRAVGSLDDRDRVLGARRPAAFCVDRNHGEGE